MTIRLIQSVRISGAEQLAGTFLTLDSVLESDLVSRGVATAVQYPGDATGYATVLFGDSMTDTYETVVSGTTGTYAATTGLLTLAMTGHQQAVGWYAAVWNRATTGALAHRRVPVVSVTDANTLVVQMPKNLAGVPASSATWFFRPESWRSAQGFVPWLQAVSGQRFNVIYNGAQSGDTTANALERLGRDCLAYNPEVVIMQALGINDTSAGNGNVAEDTIAANQRALVDRITAAGALLILLNVTPVASGESRGTKTNMSRVLRLNARLREYASRNPRVIYFDAHRLVVDPTNATGLAAANILRTADNIHYSMRGSRMIADALWTQISARFPSLASSLPTSALENYSAAATSLTSPVRTSNVVQATATSHGYQTGELVKVFGGTNEVFNEYAVVTAVDANTISFPSIGTDRSVTGTVQITRERNLLTNHLLQTATGGTLASGPTGTAADQMRVAISAGSPTVVASVVARSDGYGNDQRAVITPAAASNTVSLSNDFTSYTTTLPALMKAGRRYYAELSLSLTGVSGSNLSEILFNVQCTVDGTVYQSYAFNGYADGATLNSDLANYHLRTAPLLLPAGSLTVAKWFLQLRFSAAGTALTVDAGRVRLVEMPG